MVSDSKRMVNMSILFPNRFEELEVSRRHVHDQFSKVAKVVPEAAAPLHHWRHSQCLSRPCQTRCQCFLHRLDASASCF